MEQSKVSNLILASFLFGSVAIWILRGSSDETATLDTGLYVLFTFFVMQNVLRRPAAIEVDQRWWVCLTCFFSLFYFIGYAVSSASADRFSIFAYQVIILFHLVGYCASVYLGRSFAILPARRSIKQEFIYRVVRHPIYTTYILADFVFVLVVPSFRNALVWVFSVGLFYARARLEENILMHDPLYKEYVAKTKWRFFPGIL